MPRIRRCLDGKVLNKYYIPIPPNKGPKLKLPKDQQYMVQLMAPLQHEERNSIQERKQSRMRPAYLLPIFHFYSCWAEITLRQTRRTWTTAWSVGPQATSRSHSRRRGRSVHRRSQGHMKHWKLQVVETL